MRSFRLGSVFDIPIELDLTFLLVLPVFAWIIGSQIESRVAILNRFLGANLAAQPLTTGLTPWIFGVVAAVGLFVGVILHELGHSVTAMHYGFEIESITLWIFGGISQFSEIPEDWRQELAIAVAGPVVSVLLGIISYLAFRGLPPGANALGFLLAYLGLINVALATFNMLPAFPLDGGRVLRALLARTRPFASATQTAANVGKGFAVLLGILGLIGFNIILMGIALFVYVGAASEAQQTILKAALEGVAVEDVMTPAEEVESVASDTSVATLLDRMFSEGYTSYPVLDDGDPVGLITLERARQVDENERGDVPIRDVMTTDVPTVSTEASVWDVFRDLQKSDAGVNVVLDDRGAMAGLVSRTDVTTAFRVAQSGESGQSARPERQRGRPEFGRTAES